MINTEADLESKVGELAKSLGILRLKLSGTNYRGKADSMFEYDGRILYLEFKNPSRLQSASVNQIVFRDQARRRGTPAFITADWKFCYDLIRAFKEGKIDLVKMRDKYYDK